MSRFRCCTPGSASAKGGRSSRMPCAAPGFQIFATLTRSNYRVACGSVSGSRGRWRCGPRTRRGEEPLSALDSQTRELLMEDFIGLLADGAMGAVYVTHNLEEAVRLADRIVVLSRRPGKVREVVSIPMTRNERGDLGAR